MFQSTQSQQVGAEESTNYSKPIVYTAITAVALVGIGAVTVGLFSYFGVVSLGGLNAWAFIGGGAGAAALSSLAAAGVIYTRRNSEEEVENKEVKRAKVTWPTTNGGAVIRTVCTWNIGTDSDYLETRKKDVKLPESTLPKSFHEERTGLLRTALTALGSPDIICFQERFDYTLEELQGLLGKNYEMQSEAEGEEKRPGDTLVAWNKNKFQRLGSRVRSLNDGNSASAGVLLEDTETHLLFRVASAHIIGFKLDVEEARRRETAILGDGEMTQLADAMSLDESYDVAILGMDANVTRRAWQPRLTIVENLGFVTDPADTTDTIHEGVKLDYIYARPREGCQIAFTQIARPACTDFNNGCNPSDHSPVITQITLRAP